jgi:hypothetical protein
MEGEVPINNIKFVTCKPLEYVAVLYCDLCIKPFCVGPGIGYCLLIDVACADQAILHSQGYLNGCYSASSPDFQNGLMRVHETKDIGCEPLGTRKYGWREHQRKDLVFPALTVKLEAPNMIQSLLILLYLLLGPLCYLGFHSFFCLITS